MADDRAQGGVHGKPNPPPVIGYHVPYAEGLVAQWLRDNMVENDIGQRVYSSLPHDPVWPLIMIKQIGGSGIRSYWINLPMIQVEAWGNNKTEAWKVIEEARRAVYRMTGQLFLATDGYPDDGVITDVNDIMDVTWLPDSVTNRDRYIWTCQLATHPVVPIP